MFARTLFGYSWPRDAPPLPSLYLQDLFQVREAATQEVLHLASPYQGSTHLLVSKLQGPGNEGHARKDQGMTDRERIVEVMANRLRLTLTGRPAEMAEAYAEDLLDTLSDEGLVVVDKRNSIEAAVCEFTIAALDHMPVAPGTYRLVPVGGDS